jgi:hypothetical protein
VKGNGAPTRARGITGEGGTHLYARTDGRPDPDAGHAEARVLDTRLLGLVLVKEW